MPHAPSLNRTALAALTLLLLHACAGESTDRARPEPDGTGFPTFPNGVTPSGDGGLPGSAPPDAAVAPGTATRTFDAGSAEDRNRVQAGAVCARLAQIQCAGEAYCCDAPGREPAQCEDVMREGCIDALYLDAVSSNPRSGFDAAAAEQVFTELERLASQCDTSIASFGGSRDGLMRMFGGSVAAGGDCSPAVSDFGNPAASAAMLVSCRDIANTACLRTDVIAWTCAPRTVAGERCFTDLNCIDGLYCPNPDFRLDVDARCTARAPVGAACTTPNECATLFCKGGACVDATREAAYCLARE